MLPHTHSFTLPISIPTCPYPHHPSDTKPIHIHIISYLLVQTEAKVEELHGLAHHLLGVAQHVFHRPAFRGGARECECECLCAYTHKNAHKYVCACMCMCMNLEISECGMCMCKSDCTTHPHASCCTTAAPFESSGSAGMTRPNSTKRWNWL